MKNTASRLKKLTISSLLLAAGSMSILTHAAVTLVVDDHIKVTAINGQELSTSIFQGATKSFTLEPGTHVITAKYDRLYDLSRDEHDYLRSGNISVAADMADNQTYRLTMPNQPEKYAEAKEFAKKPTLAVQQGNTIIASQQSVAGNSGGLFSGLGKALGGVFGGGGDAEIQNQRAIAALGQSPATSNPQAPHSGAVSTSTYTVVPTANSNNTSNSSNVAASSKSNLDQFMQIWLNASADERAKMRQWIEQ